MTVICFHANWFREVLCSAGSSAIEFAPGKRSPSALIGSKKFSHGFVVVSNIELVTINQLSKKELDINIVQTSITI